MHISQYRCVASFNLYKYTIFFLKVVTEVVVIRWKKLIEKSENSLSLQNKINLKWKKGNKN